MKFNIEYLRLELIVFLGFCLNFLSVLVEPKKIEMMILLSDRLDMYQCLYLHTDKFNKINTSKVEQVACNFHPLYQSYLI